MQVALFGSLREVVEVHLLEVPAEPTDTVRVVLERLFETSPAVREKLLGDSGDLRDHVSIFLQGRNVRLLQGLDTLVEERDRLSIFPPVAGG